MKLKNMKDTVTASANPGFEKLTDVHWRARDTHRDYIRRDIRREAYRRPLARAAPPPVVPRAADLPAPRVPRRFSALDTRARARR